MDSALPSGRRGGWMDAHLICDVEAMSGMDGRLWGNHTLTVSETPLTYVLPYFPRIQSDA